MHEGNELLSSLRQRGVRLWAADGKLHFSAPKGTLSADDLQALRARRDEVLESLEQSELARGLPVQCEPVTWPVPLTALQARKWQYISERQGGLSQRTCFAVQRVTGPLDIDTLGASLHSVMRRHDSLRIRIVLVNGEAAQQVQPQSGSDLDLVDLQDARPMAEPVDVMSLCEQFVREKLDLRTGPMLAAKLFRIGPCEHVLVVAIDHMVADSVSIAIVADEIWVTYRSIVQGIPPSLPQLPLQFLDYVLWQHRTRVAWRATHGDYWKRRLSGVPPSKLPTYVGAAEIDPPVSDVQSFTLDRALSDKLRELARRERSLPALVGLAVYVAVMARWVQQRDFVLTFVSNGRDRPELQTMVGFLADYLHVRAQVEETDRFVDLLQRLTSEFHSAYQHQDYGRAPDLVPECVPELGFNWLANAGAPEAGGPPAGIHVEPLPLQLAFALPQPIKLVPLFRDTGAEISGGVFYRPDLFGAPAVERFARNLQRFAAEVAERPHLNVMSVTSQ